eukprot:scaffold37028_cov57-Attheya_sp.AAC.6
MYYNCSTRVAYSTYVPVEPIYVPVPGTCWYHRPFFVTGRGNTFETTHWTGIYPVSVFAL